MTCEQSRSLSQFLHKKEFQIHQKIKMEENWHIKLFEENMGKFLI